MKDESNLSKRICEVAHTRLEQVRGSTPITDSDRDMFIDAYRLGFVDALASAAATFKQRDTQSRVPGKN